ncbi:cell cycle sequence binding phosphoprotein (RBP33) [Trypanosoma conorhini]|uniref:Cell cycle sequence binding phosphoprotein (RBP33) n=1 Tax=Trypanosoma conorhini TaxID=83891 RepID=A0A422PBW8_9TRYP|nr:cell cycle sequence binding phosphoprotein (RBP33) [Trypanosoma conorhini]RNF15183.1 cell cycle sequence binding phosphoprotein (RBP33) [Trypanosoma conorhini]
MATTDASGNEAIIGSLFSPPSLPFEPSGGSGGVSCASGAKKRQSQTSEPLQPHAPNATSLDAATIPSTGSSGASSQQSGVARSGGDGGGNVAGMRTASPISGVPPNEGYAMSPSMYAPTLGQPPQLRHGVQQYPASMPSSTATPPAATTKQPENVHGFHGSRPALMPGKELMLERLVACLGESKGMAAAQLERAEALALSFPAVDVLRKVIEHLDEDIERLIQLRDMSVASSPVNGVAAFQQTRGEASRGALATSEVQLSNPQYRQQQPPPAAATPTLQQQQQLTDANGAPLFCAPAQAAAVAFSDQGLWSHPEARNESMNHGGSNYADGSGLGAEAATAMRQQQQQQQQQQPYSQLEAITPTSGQLTPYGGEVGASTAQAYSMASPTYIASGGDSSAMHAASAGTTGHGFIEAPVRGRGRGRGGSLLGFPPPPVEQSPSAQPKEVPPFLAFVEFKRRRVRKYECSLDISPGSYVTVDGDRGRDCGLLVQTIKTLPDGSTNSFCMDGTNVIPDKMKLEKGRVLGLATEEQTTYLHGTLANSERVALETCRRLCDELGIDIDPKDCEYQFDMFKVSFYFNSEHSVDFRPLVRELYRILGVRIWMENTNPNVKNARPITEAGGNGNAEDAAAVGEGTGSGFNPHLHAHRRGGGAGPAAVSGGNSNGTGAGRRRGQRRGPQKHTQEKDSRK